MKRGDIVTVAVAGDYGKPRPALVVQSDEFDGIDGITVFLISSTLAKSPLFRLHVEPTDENGLRLISQIMVDKAMTVPRNKVGRVIGRLDDDMMVRVNRSIALFFGLA